MNFLTPAVWVAGWLLPVSVHFAVAAGLAWLVDVLLWRRCDPRLLRALWLLVLVRLLLPPGLESPVSLAHWEPLGRVLGEAVTLQVPWAEGLAALWLTGMLLCGVVVMLGYRRERRRWLAGALPAADERLQTALRDAADRLRLSRLPPLLLHPDVPGPAVIGLRRPVMVLPTEWARLAPDRELRHVLLHELGHLRQRDPLLGVMITVLAVVYWFHPWVWLVRRRLEVLREVCCDRLVMETERDTSYRTTLARHVRGKLQADPRDNWPSYHPTFLGAGCVMVMRLQWVARPLNQRPWMDIAGRWALLLLLSVSVLPLARPVRFVVPPLSELEGCFQLRYAVFQRLAEEEARGNSPRR